MNKFLSLLVSSLLFIRLSAQNTLPTDQHLERVLPPSPEVSSIVKNGDLNVTLNTGMAMASIPIYEIKLKGFSLPISLNYSTSGTKVDEVPSRSGMGWSLNAGGVVSRKVNGNPDDQTFLINPPAYINTVSTPMVDYFNYISVFDGLYDSEPDEFIISAAGLSGRFIIDANDSLVQIPFTNNKIQVAEDRSEVIITTTEGVKYIFNVPEVTAQHNSANVTSKQQIITALFLKKIVLLNGDFIEFNYTTISPRVYNSVTQSYEKSIVELNAGEFCQVEPEAACHDGRGFTESINFAQYHTYFLSSIVASDSTKLNFTYEARLDNSSDNRLKKIVIDLGGHKKNYLFDYIDPEDAGYNAPTYFYDYNKRFFLDKVKFYGEVNGVLSDTLQYKLEYNSVTSLPSRLAYCQDHFGYFNGKSNNGLLPAMPIDEGFGTTYASADRSPDGNFSVIGTLSKITYPTGGAQEFFYEPNIYTTDERLNTFVGYKGTGGPGGTSNSAAIYSSPTFSVQRTHLAHLLVSAQQNLACSGSGEDCTPAEPNTQTIVKVEVINQTTNSIISTTQMRYYEDQNLDIELIPGNTYYLKLYAYGYASAGETSINYDTAANLYTYVTVNKEHGGVRVRKIVNYDSVTNIVQQKFYKYSHLNDLTHSSAFTLWAPDYKTYYQYVHQCACNADPSECNLYIVPEKITCKYVNLNSSSATSIYMFDSSPFGYKSVIESDDSTFRNGGIIHHFAVHDIVATNLIYGNEMKNLPINTASTTSGIEMSTEYFDSSKRIIKKIENYYSQQNISNSTATRAIKNFTLNYWKFGNTTADYLTQFDVSQYTYVSDWIKLDSIVTKDYDNNNNVFATKVTNIYGTRANILPIRSESLDSKGQQRKEEIKYVTDYAGQAPYQKMIDNNIISAVVESKSYAANNLLMTVKKNYNDYSASNAPGSAVIIMPQTVQVQNAGGSLETRLNYHKYDIKGNPVEVSKANDVKMVYVWDYDKQYPIAEVINADSSNIAYTSFEAGGTGNWSLSGTVVSNGGITGRKSFNGSLSKTVASGNYTVTLWKATGTTATVNGNSGTLLITKNGWQLDEWNLTGVSSVSVSGTNIDEIRLYPKLAQMSTMTYEPLLGVIAQSDINNRIIYYEYDIMGRLSLIRDIDRNILKKYCYNYAGKQEECSLPVYHNIVKSGTFTRNNCGTGYVAGTVTYTVPANTYSSTVSQSDADALAQADVNNNGQSYANANGTCSLIYYNVQKSGNFTRNNCGSGYTGSTVAYTVNAGTYNSTTSQAYVDGLAQANVDANGQTYANTNGTCTQSTTIYARIEYTDMYYDINEIWATVLIKFYSNSACTIPVSVSGLTVNYQGVKYLCVGGTSTDNYSTSCTGTQKSLGTQRIQWDDTGDGGSHCWDYLFSTTSGSGYVPAN